MTWPTYRSFDPPILTMWGSTKCRKNKRLPHVDHLDHVLAPILIYTLLRMTMTALRRCLHKYILKVRQVRQVRQTPVLPVFRVPHLRRCYHYKVGQVGQRKVPFNAIRGVRHAR